MITTGPLNLESLDQMTVCVVQLSTQQPGILHQVTLDPKKIKNGLIRLGDTAGDEAAGWNWPQNIDVRAILGTAVIDKDETVTVTPLVTDTEKTNALS